MYYIEDKITIDYIEDNTFSEYMFKEKYDFKKLEDLISKCNNVKSLNEIINKCLYNFTMLKDTPNYFEFMGDYYSGVIHFKVYKKILCC